MTERKPPGVKFETWVERQIREAEERGEFENLPGAGKPLPGISTPQDDLWWVRSYLHREGLSAEGLLPPSLQLRRRIEQLPSAVRALRSERAVRDAVTELNDRIAAWLRMPTGPWAPLSLVEEDAVVQQWYADRAASRDVSAATAGDRERKRESRLRRLMRRLRWR